MDKFHSFSIQDVSKIESLKQMIIEKVQNYKARHGGFFGKIYRFFSRLIYGDVDVLSQNVLKKLNDFQKNVHKPIFSKANSIIETMQEGVEHLHQNSINFELIQRLKEAKKEAKILLQNQTISACTKLEMEEVIKQYNDIVSKVEILSIFRQISREIRKPEIKTDEWGTGFPLRPIAKSFNHLFAVIQGVKVKEYHDSLLNDLATFYVIDKKKWQENWANIRQKMWNAYFEAFSFLKENKKITFITGSKSSTIPSILKIAELVPTLSSKPALIPTGQLIKHNIAPLAGELFMGITENGINQTSLSGMKFAGLNTCIEYSTVKTSQFDADKELKLILKTKKIDYIFQIPRLRIAILRLLLMGEKKESYPEIKEHITQLMNQLPVDPIFPNWLENACLIGELCTKQGKKPEGELQRGQIVGVPRSQSNPKYGIIIEKYEDGSYLLRVEKQKVTKKMNLRSLIVMSDYDLTEERQNKLALDEENRKDIESELKNDREKLQELLDLFDKVKPFKFTSLERELIQRSFPIVWASTSSSLKVKPFKTDIAGEHIVEGQAILGEDIQIVFTNRENVETLQALVKDYGVQVLSFEAGYFILGHDKNVKYQSLWD